MPCAMTVKLDGDGAFQDLSEKYGAPIHLGEGTDIRVGALVGGMTSGKTSLALGFVLPDGRFVLAETSLRLFLTVASILRARFPDEAAEIF